MLLTETSPGALSLDEIDLYPAAQYRSGTPHAAWRLLRELAPVWRQTAPDGTPFWNVLRYDDVVAVLRDTRRFSSEHSTMLTVLERDAAAGQAIHLTDPPRHSNVRTTTIRSMSMRVMRRQEPAIRERIRRLVRDAVTQGELDIAARFTGLPMLVTGELMGIPEKKWAEAAKWTVASMAPEDPAYSIGNATTTLRAAHIFLFEMFIGLVDERRSATDGEDLISLLSRMEIDGVPATQEEVLVNCYAFIMGANPTIPQSVAHFVLAMAENPALYQRIRADRSLLPGVLEETLRWSSPVNHLLRRTTTEVSVRGETIPAGALVAAWIASANRDAEVFDHPFTYDPTRRPNPHVTFGFGAHRCIGRNAAQTGLKLLIDAMVEQVESIELTGDVRHLESNFLNGITALPVRLRPAVR